MGAPGLSLKKGPMGALSYPNLGFGPKPEGRGSFQYVVWAWSLLGPPFSQGVKTRDLVMDRGRPGPGHTPHRWHRQEQLWWQWLAPAQMGRFSPSQSQAQFSQSKSWCTLPVSRSMPHPGKHSPSQVPLREGSQALAGLLEGGKVGGQRRWWWY